ncbi:hypothetical protein H8E50_11050, partial [bacterium]|nr:hypothetical protein [bacterium]
GSPNLTASGIQIFSDREDSEVEQLSSGKRYRLRFTVHNTGEAYIRRFAVNMTASGIRRLVVIQNEIEPGGNYTYTSEAMFRGRAEGTNRVEIVLDPTDTVTETNEDDNTLSWSDRDLSGVAIEGQVPPAMQMRMPAQGNDADDDAGNDAEEQHYKRAPSAPNYMRTATKTSLMQIRFIGNGSSGTNPFDFTDVQQDVADAQTPEEVVVADAVEEAQPTGEENTPDPIPSPTALNVTNSGLFFGIFSGDSIYLPITDTGAGDFSTGPGAETALRMRSDFDDNTLAGAFSLFAHTGWTIVSQTVANSVPDASQVTVVLSRDSDSNFFQITMDATLGTSSITFGSISGFNCFSSAANCP